MIPPIPASRPDEPRPEIHGHDRPALPRPRRDHRRRHRRLLHGLSPDQAGGEGRRAAGAQAPHLGHHLACRGARALVALFAEPDPARQVHGRALHAPGGGDRAGHRLRSARLHLHRHQPRALGGAYPRRRHAALLRRDRRAHLGPGGAGQVAADAGRRRRRRHLVSPRRQDQSDRHDHGAGQGRPHGRGHHRRELQGRARAGREWPRCRRRDRPGHGQGRHRRQLRGHVGPGDRQGRGRRHPAAGL